MVEKNTPNNKNSIKAKLDWWKNPNLGARRAGVAPMPGKWCGREASMPGRWRGRVACQAVMLENTSGTSGTCVCRASTVPSRHSAKQAQLRCGPL